MSPLSVADRRVLEKFLRMDGGYVLDFSDRTFGEFVLDAVGLDIHDQKYTTQGTSKAKKLRAFWKLEPDYTVGKLLLALIDYAMSLHAEPDAETRALADKCRSIATRLMAGGPSLDPLKEHARILKEGLKKPQFS